MAVYLFIRDTHFYPLELRDDAEARANAECNPGTKRVENARTGKVVWRAPAEHQTPPVSP